MANILSIRNLSRLHPYSALSEIDLELNAGERLVLVGASGSGKSKLLRTIAGLERPVMGEVVLAPHARVEWVAQDPALARSGASVREHLERSLKRMPRRDRPESLEQSLRVDQALELLELEAQADYRVSELSDGERKRVVLGCALVRQPQVLLLDEPFSQLDAPLRERIKTGLLALQREQGSVWVVATQDLREAMSLDCPIAVMDHGLIEQVGSAEELYHQPASRVVGSLARMNFLEGRLDLRDGRRVFAYADGETEGLFLLDFVKDVPEVPGAEPGRGSLVLGVLPEFLRVARTAEELGGFEILETALPGQTVLPGWEAPWLASREEAIQFGAEGGALRRIVRVLRLEKLGRETRLIVDVGGQGWELWLGPQEMAELRAGDRCWLEIKREALQWFDAQGFRLSAPAHEGLEEPLGTLALEDEPRTRGLKVEKTTDVAERTAKKISENNSHRE